MKVLTKLALLPLALISLFLVVVLIQFSGWAVEAERLTADQMDGYNRQLTAALNKSSQSLFSASEIARGLIDSGGTWTSPPAEYLTSTLLNQGNYATVALFNSFGEKLAMSSAGVEVSAFDSLLSRISSSIRLGGRALRQPVFVWSEQGDLVSLSLVAMPSEGHDTTLVALKIWDEPLLEGLAREVGALGFEIVPHRLDSDAPGSVFNEDLGPAMPLLGFDQKPVAYLTLPLNDSFLAEGIGFMQSNFLLLWLLLCVFLCAFIGFIFIWIALPLSHLSKALSGISGDNQTSGPSQTLKEMAEQKNEFGELARLIGRFLDQKTLLELEIAERKRIEHALQESEAELKAALKRRESLARDLHDTLIQSIFSVALRVRAMKRFLPSNGDAQAAQSEITEVSGQLKVIIQDMRNLIAELEPAHLQGHSLADAIQRLVKSLSTSYACDFEVTLPDELCEEIPRDTQLNLFHIIHEAFSNALRHGGAQRISCVLRRVDGESIEIQIVDDGCGFEPENFLNRGSGLQNMLARARDVGADVKITSKTGGPTEILLEGL